MNNYEQLVVKDKEKLIPLGYIHKNDHEKAMEIFLENKNKIKEHDIALYIFRNLRKIPKKNLKRIKYKNKHMFYLTDEDKNKWEAFLEKNKNKEAEELKKEFLKFFKCVDVVERQEEKKNLLNEALNELEKIKEKIQNLFKVY